MENLGDDYPDYVALLSKLSLSFNAPTKDSSAFAYDNNADRMVAGRIQEIEALKERLRKLELMEDDQLQSITHGFTSLMT